MMGMVEKVARAICRSMLQDPDIDYEVHHQDGLVKGWKMYESEARAAIEAMQVMWQPIETAPKDGRDVDVCYFKRHSELAHEYERTTNVHWNAEKKWVEWTDVGFARMGFKTMRPQPTHWMPVPPKPNED